MLSSAVSRLSFIFSFDFLLAHSLGEAPWACLRGLALIPAAWREGASLVLLVCHFHLPVGVLGECDSVLITPSQL